MSWSWFLKFAVLLPCVSFSTTWFSSIDCYQPCAPLDITTESVLLPIISCCHKFSLQGSGWKVVASFEGNFPNRIKQLPLDKHFDINNVKRVWFSFIHIPTFVPFKYVVVRPLLFAMFLFNWYQIVLEADGYQPYLISPEKGLRSLIKIVLELAKEPSRLCVDEVTISLSSWMFKFMHQGL